MGAWFRIHRPPLYPKQLAAIYEPRRYSLIEASTKAGKTSGCISWIIEQAMTIDRPDGKNFWWVAPVTEQARIAFDRARRAVTCRAVMSPFRIILPNGAIIWFKSGDKPDSLYGEDVYAAVIDEASRVKEGAWHAIRSTVSKTRGPIRIIGNVKGRKNWFFQFARRAEQNPDDPSMAYHKMVAADAVEAGVLTEEEIDDARRTLPEHVFRELYLAEPSDDGGNPFGLANIKACVVPEMHDGVPEVFGVDLAKSVDWNVVIGMTREGYVCSFDRWQRTPWEYTTERILKIIGTAPTLVDSTGVGDPIVEALQKRTHTYPDDEFGQVQGYKFTASSKQQLMEGLALTIQSHGITFPAGPIVMELEQFEYQMASKDGRFTGVKYTAPAGFHDDCVMALALADIHRKRARLPLHIPDSVLKAVQGFGRQAWG